MPNDTTPDDRTATAHIAARTGAQVARRGMLWFALGAAVIIATHLLRGSSPSTAGRLAPFVPMCAGAYGLVLGLEKMVTGWRQDRSSRLAASCLLVVALGAASGSAAYLWRAPYWGAIKTRNRGEAASQRLKAISERQVARLQQGADGAAALSAWDDAAESALPLRDDFQAALAAARYLEKEASGAVRAQASIDASFYALCLEWIDLYERVKRLRVESSMLEPPDEWSHEQDDIIDRIQALPTHPPEGS